MKKSYSKAEAYKVNFNANEQVAATDPCYKSKDTSKYDYDFSGCTDEGGQYASTLTSYTICMVGSDGVASSYFGESAGLDFDDLAAEYESPT